MSVITSLVSWGIKKRHHQINLFLEHPFETQNDTLYSLLEKTKDTEFGRKHNFSKIKSLKDFKKNVPISSYEDLYPYIQKMLDGEKNILWPDDIKWFSKSSGTTNAKSKFIPVSQESLENCHYRGGKDLLAFYLRNNPNSKMFSGKNLALGGSRHTLSNQKDIFVGDVSAVIIQNLPLWAEWVRTPDMETALLENYEEKLEKIIQKVHNKNVTNLAGVPTWSYILIKKLLEKTDKNNLLEIWPNFEVYFHGGVNFDPYRELFKSLIPSDKVFYINSYNASEGFFGVQDTLLNSEMLLMLDYGIYYEFIPMENFFDEKPEALSLSEVELGKNYALVITTNAGLFRYLIGDTIRFTSLNPFRFVITGRTKHFINAFGEELMIENADEAIKYACKETNSSIADFTAAPLYFSDSNFGAHQWLIEFEKEPENITLFKEKLDSKLKEVNSDYEAKRSGDIALKEPVITIASKGTFYNWMKQRGKLGGQNKVPRLSNDRAVIESVLGSIEK